jgi:hypothetical protein
LIAGDLKLGLLQNKGVDPSHFGSVFGPDPETYVANYLTIWPLIAATSLRVLDHESNVEYILPNLLMDWIHDEGRYDGVRYFTTKDDMPLGNHDYSINIALIARKANRRGYCRLLRESVLCTEPLPVREFFEGKKKPTYQRVPEEDRERLFDIRTAATRALRDI